MASYSVYHIFLTWQSKHRLLTCSRWTDEATNASEKHKDPQSAVESLQGYNVHNGVDVNGHHAAEQEAMEWGEHQDGPVVVADGQQQEHDPEESGHHGEQLQVPQQPHVGYPPTSQPSNQVSQRKDREDRGWPVPIHPQTVGKGH